jgi:hypothetical protein
VAVKARPLIQAGALATILGVAVALILNAKFGGMLVVLGMASQGWGLHLLGRSGTQPE